MSNLQENHSIALEGERLPMEEGNVEHTLLIDYKGLHFVMRMTMYAKAAWDFHRMSWGDIEDQCRMIKLTSSLFSTFDRKPNMKLQLDVLTNHQDFHQFLDCALALHSSRPLHKENVVMIEIDLGWGLGEIRLLTSWRIEPVSKILSEMESGLDTEVLEKMLNVDPNSMDSPRGSSRPHQSSYCPVLFYCRKARIYYVVPTNIAIATGEAPISNSECKRCAQHYFQQLQAVSMPPVQSPPLDE